LVLFSVKKKKDKGNETDPTAEVSRQPEKEASFTRKPDFLSDVDSLPHRNIVHIE
jgi:hypothetical protein